MFPHNPLPDRHLKQIPGTPLQNNKRELFNLLQFLDKSIDAAELDETYAELTKENLPELHELIRPFFLRYVLHVDAGNMLN